MIGILRLALTYFSVVPLQTGVSVIGALLIALCLVLGAFGIDAAPLALLGSGLAGMIPAMLGGTMFRYGISRTTLHLRPHGRARMLLAATLVITLLAALATLPLQLAQHVPAHPGHPRSLPANLSPLAIFAISWSLAALVWVGTFIVSSSQLVGLVGLLPLVLVKLRVPVASLLPDPVIVLAAGVALWIAFALWYLQARAIRPTCWTVKGAATRGGMTHTGILVWRVGESRGALTRAGATNLYLLGATSMASFILSGLFWVLLAALMPLMLPWLMTTARGTDILWVTIPVAFTPMFLVTCASLGASIARRARLLWLRGGMDRMELHAKAERDGLAGCALLIGVAAVAFVGFSLITWPAHTTGILLFAAVQILFAANLFYCGLALTRGWNADDALMCVGQGAFFFFEIFVFRPWRDAPASLAPALLGLLVLLIFAMRWLSRRRWLALDWRVARLPSQILRAT